MNIPKAIEILAEKVKHPYSRTRLAYPDALKLGIEALKLVDTLRFDGSPFYPKLLEGETEEKVKRR